MQLNLLFFRLTRWLGCSRRFSHWDKDSRSDHSVVWSGFIDSPRPITAHMDQGALTLFSILLVSLHQPQPRPPLSLFPSWKLPHPFTSLSPRSVIPPADPSASPPSSSIFPSIPRDPCRPRSVRFPALPPSSSHFPKSLPVSPCLRVSPLWSGWHFNSHACHGAQMGASASARNPRNRGPINMWV